MTRRGFSKYGAKKVVNADGTFDSASEAFRWYELKGMAERGEIKDLQRQVKYVLIPTQKEPDTTGPRGGVIKGKTIEKECAYFADFVYERDGEIIVEDVKGVATPEFNIKKKLMLERYGIRIQIVKVKNPRRHRRG